MILPLRYKLILLLTASCLTGLAFAQENVTQDDLKTYEEQLEATRKEYDALVSAKEAAKADMGDINRQLLVAAQDSLRREEQASQVEKSLIDLEIRTNEAREQLMADREGLREVMAALISATRRKPPALATHPDKATDAIQAAIVMRDVADALETRSKELAIKVRDYADLTEKVQKKKNQLDEAEQKLTERQDEIQRLAAMKRATYEDVSGEAVRLKARMDALASKAENIKSLLAELEEAAPPPPSRKPSVLNAPKGKGPEAPVSVAVLSRLGLPAAGQVVQQFGDDLPTGRESEGIKVRTRASAQVVAPSDSVIVWTGPFRSYGQMLILRTGDGYHIVLSGLESVYGSQGQSVLAGEPIGQMPTREDIPTELYMELRKDGKPEDPAKWMSRSAG